MSDNIWSYIPLLWLITFDIAEILLKWELNTNQSNLRGGTILY